MNLFGNHLKKLVWISGQSFSRKNKLQKKFKLKEKITHSKESIDTATPFQTPEERKLLSNEAALEKELDDYITEKLEEGHSTQDILGSLIGNNDLRPKNPQDFKKKKILEKKIFREIESKNISIFHPIQIFNKIEELKKDINENDENDTHSSDKNNLDSLLNSKDAANDISLIENIKKNMSKTELKKLLPVQSKNQEDLELEENIESLKKLNKLQNQISLSKSPIKSIARLNEATEGFLHKIIQQKNIPINDDIENVEDENQKNEEAEEEEETKPTKKKMVQEKKDKKKEILNEADAFIRYKKSLNSKELLGKIKKDTELAKYGSDEEDLNSDNYDHFALNEMIDTSNKPELNLFRSKDEDLTSTGTIQSLKEKSEIGAIKLSKKFGFSLEDARCMMKDYAFELKKKEELDNRYKEIQKKREKKKKLNEILKEIKKNNLQEEDNYDKFESKKTENIKNSKTVMQKINKIEEINKNFANSPDSKFTQFDIHSMRTENNLSNYIKHFFWSAKQNLVSSILLEKQIIIDEVITNDTNTKITICWKFQNKSEQDQNLIEKIQGKLKKFAPYFRGKMCKDLQFGRAPEIVFFYSVRDKVAAKTFERMRDELPSMAQEFADDKAVVGTSNYENKMLFIEKLHNLEERLYDGLQENASNYPFLKPKKIKKAEYGADGKKIRHNRNKDGTRKKYIRLNRIEKFWKDL